MSDESTTPPPPPPPPPSGGAPASVGIRFGARLIDGLLIGIPLAVILAVLNLDDFLISGVINSVVYVAYFTYLESDRGQTIGKQLLNLRTVGPDGGLPTQQQAFVRNAWILIGIIPILGGLVTFVLAIAIGVTISSSPDGRGLHDNWASGTTVVTA